MKSDVIVGLQHGDEGKGKVVCALLKDNNYDYCLRFNGGPNAGHTIVRNNNKVVLHQIPCGILNNITSVIGSGCVVDLEKLKSEINLLQKLSIPVESLLKISYNAHVISKHHIQEDINNDPIGSTHSGIRPVNRDKYNRSGTRICDIDKNTLEKYIGECSIVDPYKLFHENIGKNKLKCMCEGAQGFELDIDYGSYPFVTSTHTVTGFVNASGVPINTINKVYGISKIYATYVGSKDFQPKDDKDLEKLGVLGEEFGSTTNRKRKINWLNLDRLRQAIIINSVTDLIINKCDILEQLNVYKLINNSQKISFNTFSEMKKYITNYLKDITSLNNIIFSGNKEFI